MRARGLVRELWFALGSAVVALFLLRYLHDEWLIAWAVGCGVVAGVFLRRAIEPTYETFPNFLRRPLNLAMVLLGTIVAVWATLAAPRYSTLAYWTAHGFEALYLASAGSSLKRASSIKNGRATAPPPTA